MEDTDKLFYYVGSVLPGFFMLAVSIIGIVLLKANETKLHKFFYMFCFVVLALVLVVSLLFQVLMIKSIFDARMKAIDEEKKLSMVVVPQSLTDKKSIEDYKYKYFLEGDHKAFAKSPDGPYGYISNRASVEDAKEYALKYCEWYRKEKSAPCEIISIDGKPIENK